jgi:hypothetical protein
MGGAWGSMARGALASKARLSAYHIGSSLSSCTVEQWSAVTSMTGECDG